MSKIDLLLMIMRMSQQPQTFSVDRQLQEIINQTLSTLTYDESVELQGHMKRM